MRDLLGSLLAGVLMVAAVILFMNYQKQGNLNMQVAATAQQATQFNTAVQSYITQYSSNISAVATASTPATITVAMLQAPAVGLLPSSFSTTNPFGQTWQAQVLQPTAGNLNALALGTGGTQLTDQVASRVAALIGASGGFIPLNDSGTWPTGIATAQGAYAGWSLPTAGFTGIAGGNIASLLTFSNGQFVSNYLYRNNVGNPSLNTMTTPIIMASTQTLNGPCTTTGAIAQDGAGAVLSCQAGTWQMQGSAYWKDPVVNYISLPVCNAAAAWQTRVVKSPTVGTGPRAYTCDGSIWQALAVNDAGNMTVAATMSVGMVQLNTVVTAGTACATNGLVAQDGTGLILSCQSGIWKGGSSRATYVYKGLSYAGSVSLINNYGASLFVVASGGEQNPYCGNNNYDLQAYVDGVWVSGASNTNQIGSKTTSTSFLVPAGSSYTITSSPWNCGVGQIILSAATF